jgi:hypothetical protein
MELGKKIARASERRHTRAKGWSTIHVKPEMDAFSVYVIMAQSRTGHDTRALRPCKLLPLLGSVAFKVLRFTKLRLPS